MGGGWADRIGSVCYVRACVARGSCVGGGGHRRDADATDAHATTVEVFMIAVVQRVLRGKVTVGGEVVGQIGPGLVVLAAVEVRDTEADAACV